MDDNYIIFSNISIRFFTYIYNTMLADLINYNELQNKVKAFSDQLFPEVSTFKYENMNLDCYSHFSKKTKIMFTYFICGP